MTPTKGKPHTILAEEDVACPSSLTIRFLAPPRNLRRNPTSNHLTMVVLVTILLRGITHDVFLVKQNLIN